MTEKRPFREPGGEDGHHRVWQWKIRDRAALAVHASQDADREVNLLDLERRELVHAEADRKKERDDGDVSCRTRSTLRGLEERRDLVGHQHGRVRAALTPDAETHRGVRNAGIGCEAEERAQRDQLSPLARSATNSTAMTGTCKEAVHVSARARGVAAHVEEGGRGPCVRRDGPRRGGARAQVLREGREKGSQVHTASV